MTRDQFIDKLNEDLRLELQSIVQYIQHVAVIKGARFQDLVDELEKHIGQEVSHATTLARQIDFLGGVPETAATEIRPAVDSERALLEDLELEEQQLERYRQRVSEAEELGLPDVAEALAPLLRETQDHVRDLRVALDV